MVAEISNKGAGTASKGLAQSRTRRCTGSGNANTHVTSLHKSRYVHVMLPETGMRRGKARRSGTRRQPLPSLPDPPRTTNSSRAANTILLHVAITTLKPCRTPLCRRDSRCTSLSVSNSCFYTEKTSLREANSLHAEEEIEGTCFRSLRSHRVTLSPTSQKSIPI
jgi:hypothetical protein